MQCHKISEKDDLIGRMREEVNFFKKQAADSQNRTLQSIVNIPKLNLNHENESNQITANQAELLKELQARFLKKEKEVERLQSLLVAAKP